MTGLDGYFDDLMAAAACSDYDDCAVFLFDKILADHGNLINARESIVTLVNSVLTSDSKVSTLFGRLCGLKLPLYSKSESKTVLKLINLFKKVQ
jgi:hypothetical protein